MTMSQHDDSHEMRRRLEEAEETLRAIRSGEVDALVVSGTDGDRIYTLEGADHPYRALIEAMQQGAASITGDGMILYCNQCFTSMLGYPQQTIIGASVASFLPDHLRTIFVGMLREGLALGCQRELQLCAADGTLLPVLVLLSPLHLADTVTLCMVVTDLTEPKKHQDLMVANRRKDEFLAMLAHELRNPLAPIQNAVALLQQPGMTEDRLTYAREIIERQVRHLVRLVDDLLDVSRMTLGRVKLKKKPVELIEVMQHALETSRPIIDSRKHRMTLSLPPKGVRVDGDPTRLAQIIGNLLTNAAKYTDEGGTITLTADPVGDQVVIRVRDTGMGIPSELLPHVFDLFIQGDRTLDRSEGGLGIGLTLVRRLVELHGGTVEAQSAGPGQGSEFIVRLPILPAEQKTIATADSNNGATATSHHQVLIVEDNKDGAESLAMLLRLMGHQVRVVYSGFEAVDIARAMTPNVVLLDIGLPGMSGYEVARRLRSLPELSKTMLVAMTGYGQEEDRHRSRDAGFDHHLVKPVTSDVLKRVLNDSRQKEMS